MKKSKIYTNVRQYGNDILYMGYDENGKRVQERIPYCPNLYTIQTENSPKSQFTNIDGCPLTCHSFDDIKSAKSFIDSLAHSNKIYGMNKFNYQYIADEFPETEIQYDFTQLRIYYFDIETRSQNGMPSVEATEDAITCVTVKDVKYNALHVWTIKGSGGGPSFDPHNLQYIKNKISSEIIHHECVSEADLLRSLMDWFEENPADILSGWNTKYFDIPYLYRRICKVIGPKIAKKISPWNITFEKVDESMFFNTIRKEIHYDLYGVNALDYKELYQKYVTSGSESYALDFIAEKHLGYKKLEYEGSLDNLFLTDYQKYVEYNILDTDIVHELDKRLNFMALIVEISYAGKVATYNDSLGTVAYWEYLIYNHLRSQNIQIEVKFYNYDSNKNKQYAGGYVKLPQTGMHEYVVSFDLTSLYPSIIRQVNIGPETLVEDIPEDLQTFLSTVTVDNIVNKQIDTSILKQYNLSLSGNGKLYKRDKKSFLSELMEIFFNKRQAYKKLMLEASKEYERTHDENFKKLEIIYNIKQMAFKILINAAYGAIGNASFQYFSVNNAEAVTLTGQAVIQSIEKKVNSYLNSLLKIDPNTPEDFVIASDTDSLYIRFSSLVNKIFTKEEQKTDSKKVIDFLDKVAQDKLAPIIDAHFDDLFHYLNGVQNHMVMKREIISDKAVWTGKKRYYMNVWDKEGTRFTEPELKVLGIEVVKSSTPKVCREALRQCLIITLRQSENDLVGFISKFRKTFNSLPAKDVAFPRSCNELYKWQTNDAKGFAPRTPIHVRGVIEYNKLIDKLNLSGSYEKIKQGNKIKFLYLAVPNITYGNIISFADNILPAEFNIERHIDYNTQFEKSFIDPLKTITDLISWKMEKTNDLSSCFV